MDDFDRFVGTTADNLNIPATFYNGTELDQYFTFPMKVFKYTRPYVEAHISRFYKRDFEAMRSFLTNENFGLLGDEAFNEIPFYNPANGSRVFLTRDVGQFQRIVEFFTPILEEKQIIVVISGGAAINYYTLARDDTFGTVDFDLKFVSNEFYELNPADNSEASNLANIRSFFILSLLCSMTPILIENRTLKFKIENRFDIESPLQSYSFLTSININDSDTGLNANFMDIVGFSESWKSTMTAPNSSTTSNSLIYFTNPIIDAYSPELSIGNAVSKNTPLRFHIHFKEDPVTKETIILPIFNIAYLLFDTLRMNFYYTFVDTGDELYKKIKRYKYKIKLAILLATLNLPNINSQILETCDAYPNYESLFGKNGGSGAGAGAAAAAPAAPAAAGAGAGAGAGAAGGTGATLMNLDNNQGGGIRRNIKTHRAKKQRRRRTFKKSR
jgi:hypothetical protein